MGCGGARYITTLDRRSTFSYLDGYGLPEQHVARAAELGMPALAMTEHGNVSSHVRLEKACASTGGAVRPIFGCEVYVGETSEATRSKWKNHLTVLAENPTGYRNLLRLVSRGWDEYYFEPTVDVALLREHSEGLVVLSGCSGSALACNLLGGKGIEPGDAHLDRALRIVQEFQDIFGERYYLEAQAFPTLDRSRDINAALVEISKKTGIGIVATGDVHYTRDAENQMQILLHAVGRGGRANSFEQQAQSWGYDVSLAPPLTDAAVLERMMGTGLSRRWAERTVGLAGEVAERCSGWELPKMDRLRFPVAEFGGVAGDGASDAVGLIWAWMREGWRYRRGLGQLRAATRAEYAQRLAYEMSVIVEKDFVDYFLLLSDVVRAAKDSGVPVGPARGSAAASLVCYLLRITEVDPLQYPIMLFERFIDLTRFDLPDVDLDFDDERRDEVRQHLVRRYGADRVGNIGTFTKYRGKNALDDVARVHRIPSWEVERVKDLLVERSGGDSRFDATLEDTIEMFADARAVFEKYPKLEMAIQLEGNLRGMGVHSAGLVVANEPLTNVVAVYSRTMGDGRRASVLSVDKYDAEHLGVLKIDALGLNTMGLIRHALEMLEMPLDDLYKIPMDDPDTIEIFRSNDVVGIFQFEGRATRSVNGEVRPTRFLEICDVNALSRPGPLHSGSTNDYIAVKLGRKEPDSLGPVVDRITAGTRGQIIYQEQILQIVREVGGFPWTHAAAIRKIISQKKGESAFNQMWEMFRDGASRLHQISEQDAANIWKRLVTAGTYAFCACGDILVWRDAVNTSKGNGSPIRLDELYRRLNPPLLPARRPNDGQPPYEGPCVVCLKYSEVTWKIGKRAHYRRGVCRYCIQWQEWTKQRGGISIMSMDDDGRIRPRRVVQIYDPVERDVLRVTTAADRVMRWSTEHSVLTQRGYVGAMELRVGDQLVARGPLEPTPEDERASASGRGDLLRQSQEEVWRRARGRCEHCGKAVRRGRVQDGSEFAHILTLSDVDGVWEKYHAASNLLVLCNPCHKRFDWGRGQRKRKWTRGRLTTWDTVVSVEPDGRDLVYDVEMEPNVAGAGANYLGGPDGGVVHHNNSAHSVSYSMLAFWTAWLKSHHPAEFYAAALRKYVEAHRQQALMRDAVKHGIRVLGPDLVLSGGSWTVASSPPSTFLSFPESGDPIRNKISKSGDSGANRAGAEVGSRAVRAGFSQVPGIGEKMTAAVLAGREEARAAGRSWEGVGWEALLSVRGIGAKKMATIRAFAEHADPFGLETLRDGLDVVRKALENGELVGPEGDLPKPDYRAIDVPYDPGTGIPSLTWLGVVRARNLRDLFEEHRSRTGENLDPGRITRPDLKESMVLYCEDDTEDLNIKVDRFHYPAMAEAIWGMELGRDLILIQGFKRGTYGRQVTATRLWVINPE